MWGCRVQWFARAGFVDIKIKRIGPSWYRGVRRHGLIIGCSVTGVKPKVPSRSFQPKITTVMNIAHILSVGINSLCTLNCTYSRCSVARKANMKAFVT